MIRTLFAAALVLTSAGCGGQTDWSERPVPPEQMLALASANQAEIATGLPEIAALDRKIIYQATITLGVEDFSALEQHIQALVEQHGGYSTDVVIDRTNGQQLTGHWTVRIPVDRYAAFLDHVSKLGVAHQFTGLILNSGSWLLFLRLGPILQRA